MSFKLKSLVHFFLVLNSLEHTPSCLKNFAKFFKIWIYYWNIDSSLSDSWYDLYHTNLRHFHISF